jgi:hypothetical protein
LFLASVVSGNLTPMGIFDSLRKRSPVPKTTAEQSFEKSAALQVLFESPLSDDTAHLQRVVRAFDPTLRSVLVGGIGTGNDADTPRSFLGQAEWGAHRVEIVAFGLPMPSEVVEKCVAPAPFQDDDKERARSQKAHALLYYKGKAANMTEQFVAVALIAGALCGEGGLAVLNEGGHTSMPATLFSPQFTRENGITPAQFLRALSPLDLFAGFVKYQIEGVPGVWMRTHGMDEFGLPNLATHAPGHEQSSRVFGIFSNVTSYLLAQGPVLEAGHTMQIGDDEFMRLRGLTADEAPLDDGVPLLVAEFIRSEEANPHIFGSERAH